MAESIAQSFGRGSVSYKAYRPQYPDALFHKILQRVPRPYTNALDIGAGTGLSTAFLAKTFAYVVTVEPDKRMVGQGTYPDGVEVIVGRAEEAVFQPDTFQLITSGNSFYWTDGAALVRLVEKWLVGKGVFAVFRYGLPTTNSEPVNEILQRELLTNWDKHRHERLRDTGYSYRTISESGLFGSVDCLNVKNEVALSLQSLVGFFASTSYCIGYMDNLREPEKYLAGLLAELESACTGANVMVDFGLELVTAAKG